MVIPHRQGKPAIVFIDLVRLWRVVVGPPFLRRSWLRSSHRSALAENCTYPEGAVGYPHSDTVLGSAWQYVVVCKDDTLLVCQRTLY